MKLNYSESSLVIIGGWNPIIVNPVWIDNYLVESPASDNQSRINVSFDMDNTLAIKDAAVSVSFDGIKISLRGNRLQFHLDTGNDFTLLEKYALKMCKVLPNTLVSGYGANFHFHDEKINQSIANIIDTEIFDDVSSQLTSNHCTIVFNFDDMIMNISQNINTAENTSGVGFNFHFNIGRLPDFESSLSMHSLSSLRDRAIQILSDVYGLEVEV